MRERERESVEIKFSSNTFVSERLHLRILSIKFHRKRYSLDVIHTEWNQAYNFFGRNISIPCFMFFIIVFEFYKIEINSGGLPFIDVW